jgi:hypothetical protein
MRRSTTITLCATLLFAVFVFYSLRQVEPLQVSNGRLEHLGDQVVVRGRLGNSGGNPQVAGLLVRLFDATGHEVGRRMLPLGRLEPGQEITFSTPPVRADGVEKFTIQVDRGANMYGN